MRYFVPFACCRVITVLFLVCIFLPPDYMNPHALGDTVMAVMAGVVWAVSDFRN